MGEEIAMNTSQKKTVDERDVEVLEVDLSCGALQFHRRVWPVDDSTADEIREAMKEDAEFLNPFVVSGMLTVRRDGKTIVVAAYNREDYCGETFTARIDDVRRFNNAKESAVLAASFAAQPLAE
jgi:hypothetical protein